MLTEEFGLHPLAVEDALHEHQRAKLDHYARPRVPRGVRRPAVRGADDTLLETGEMAAFLTPHGP